MPRQSKKNIPLVDAAPRDAAAPVHDDIENREIKDIAGGEVPNAKEDSEAVLEEEPAELSDEAKEIASKTGAYYEGRYYYGLGRRKTSIAQVRLFTKGRNKKFLVNGVDYRSFFKLPRLVHEVEKPLVTMKAGDKFGIKVKVIGGGMSGQAGAVRLALARALVEFNADFRKRLRRRGFLTRDARMVERKKYGKRKARRSPQWSKR